MLLEQYKNEMHDKFREVEIFLQGEYSNISSMGAHPSLLNKVKINYYNDLQPLKNIANIQAKDYETLFVSMYDESIIREAAKTISKFLPNLNPVIDGKIIKINVPKITEERRLELVKITKINLEEAKIKMRNVRKEFFNKIKNNKELSENEVELYENELQKETNNFNQTLENLQKEKEKELLKI